MNLYAFFGRQCLVCLGNLLQQVLVSLEQWFRGKGFCPGDGGIEFYYRLGCIFVHLWELPVELEGDLGRGRIGANLFKRCQNLRVIVDRFGLHI